MEEIFRTFGVNTELLIIQAVNFGLLLAALWYFLYRPLARIIEERRRKIAQGVKDAEAAAAHLAEVEGSKSEILTKATHEAEDFVVRAKKRAAEEERLLMSEAERKGARLIAEAAKRAEEERAKILRESRNEVARLAILAAEKVLREKTS